MTMTESHFPWVAILRNQLKRFSLSSSTEDYKKLLKKFEGSVSEEVIKLKSKPKRSTKFSHILKSLISNLKIIQYSADVKSDESILSALGLIATHYVNLIQSSSLLDRDSPSDIANCLYSFIQVALEQSREFILDVILALGTVPVSEANPIVIQLFKNVIQDKSKYQNDSATFFKFLTFLKLLMQSKIAEKKIRKIILEASYPTDFPAYLREKLHMKVKAGDIDLVAVLSKIKPELVIEECKSRLSVKELNKREDDRDQAASFELMDSDSLFFIDVGTGNEEIHTEVIADSTPSTGEEEEVAGSLESEDERDAAQEANEVEQEQKSSNESAHSTPNGEILSESEAEAGSNYEFSADAVENGNGSRGFDGDGVDYDENHENAVVTDPESDEEIPLLELDSDFDGDSFTNMNNSAEEHSELVRKKDNRIEGDLELQLPDTGNSDAESDDSDDTVQLHVTKIRKNAENLKIEEESGSNSDNQNENDLTDLQLQNPVRDDNEDSISSTDTVEMSNARERPSNSPELKKATSPKDATEKAGATSTSTAASISKSNGRSAGEISPRRTRASSRQGVTTPLQNEKQAPAPRPGRRTRAKVYQVVEPVKNVRKDLETHETRVSPKKAEVIAAVYELSTRKSETEHKSKSVDEDDVPERNADDKNSTASPIKKSSHTEVKVTLEKQTRTRNARTGRKSASRDPAPAPLVQSPIAAAVDSSKSNTENEIQDKVSELPSAEPNRRVTRSSRAESSSPSPAKMVPIARRSRKVSGSPATTANRSTPKKAKVDLEAVILESAEGEEQEHENEKAEPKNGNVETNIKPPIASAQSTSRSTGERLRYNLRRRSAHKN